MAKKAKTVSIVDLRVGDEILQDHGQALAVRTYRVLREAHEPIVGAVYWVRNKSWPSGNPGKHDAQFIAYYTPSGDGWRWEFMDQRNKVWDAYSGTSRTEDTIEPIRLLWAPDGSHLPDKHPDIPDGGGPLSFEARGYNAAVRDAQAGKVLD